VVTAKLHLLSRTLEPSAGYTDVKTYKLGLDATGAPITAGPFNDGYRRNVYTAAVRIVNPSARRDAP
jgi:type IV pilus assembly protein PilW